MRAAGEGRGPLRCGESRGFILLTVLVAILALTALSMAALALAMAEHRSAEWERRWVGGAAEGAGSVPHPVADLGGGYRVVAPGSAAGSAAEGAAASPAPGEAGSAPGSTDDGGATGPPPGASSGAPVALQRVAWCLDPAAEAAGAWGPEAGAGGEGEAVDAASGADSGADSGLASSGAASGDEGALGAPWPHPLPPPRLGPLGAGALLEVMRPGGARAGPGALPPGLMVDGLAVEGPEPGLPPPDFQVAAGPGGAFLLVAEGGLRLVAEEGGVLHGAVIAGGPVVLGPGVRLVGGVRGDGGALQAGAGFERHRGTVEGALRALPGCPALLAELGRLGRYRTR